MCSAEHNLYVYGKIETTLQLIILINTQIATTAESTKLSHGSTLRHKIQTQTLLVVSL